jgi:hypothetical protein
MIVDRDLSYARAVLEAVMADLAKDNTEESRRRFESCELLCKISQLYEEFDSIEFTEHTFDS